MTLPTVEGKSNHFRHQTKLVNQEAEQFGVAFGAAWKAATINKNYF